MYSSAPQHPSLDYATSMDYSESPASLLSPPDHRTSPNLQVQSPGTMAAQFDSNFVHKHNATAEIYQTFKEDVDSLFSGAVPVHNKPHFISSILNTTEQLILAMESEKHYLMSQVLCSWAVAQQKLSVATCWTQQINYNLLNTIDTQFEYFGELLEQTLSGLSYLIAEYPKAGFEAVHVKLRNLSHLFLFYSVIVSKQPPAVVVKCGEAENHRRSRFWFNTEIRILGGRAFGLDASGENVQIQCHLITDETAKTLRSNAYHDITGHEEFVIEPSVSALKNAELNATLGTGTCTPSLALLAKFDDMRVAKKEQLRRESVAQKRYHLCYSIRISTAKHQIDLIGKKVSLPFAILVGPKSDVDAKLFLERSFADFVRRPDGELPQTVNCHEMADALEMKFQAILEIPQKPTDTPGLQQPRIFTSHSKQHLINRLKPNLNGQILVENFLKMPVAEEFCVSKRTVSSSSSLTLGVTPTPGFMPGTPIAGTPSVGSAGGVGGDGEWKLVPFYEWYFKLAEMVNKHFLQMWNDGLIFGFCSKDEAERLMQQDCRKPTLLIRFSDIEFAKVKISVRDQNGVIRHHWYDQQELQGRSLNQELLNNAKYREVECIYPNINLEWAIGARERSQSVASVQQRKPRHLQPSPIYFDNQGAGTSF